MRSFSPSKSDFTVQVTLSAQRGAESHPARVVSVVVVVVTIGVDIVNVVIVVIVGRTQPPPGRGTSNST